MQPVSPSVGFEMTLFEGKEEMACVLVRSFYSSNCTYYCLNFPNSLESGVMGFLYLTSHCAWMSLDIVCNFMTPLHSAAFSSFLFTVKGSEF